MHCALFPIPMFRLGRSFYRGWYHSPPAKPLIRVHVGSHGFKFGLHLTLKVSDGFKCPIFSTILLSVNVEQIQEQYCRPCNCICKSGGIQGFFFSCQCDIYLYVLCVFVNILVFEFVFEFASVYVCVSHLKI